MILRLFISIVLTLFICISDSKAINFTLCSYTDSSSYKQEQTRINIIDTIDFNTELQTVEVSDRNPGFIYIDTDTNVKFTVPTNWTQKALSKDREYIDAKFVSCEKEGLIGLALWALIPGFMAKKKGRSFWGYYFLSFIISPFITMIIVAFLRNLNKPADIVEDIVEISNDNDNIVLPQSLGESTQEPDNVIVNDEVLSEKDGNVKETRLVCGKCGNYLINGSRFCGTCGTPVVDKE